MANPQVVPADMKLYSALEPEGRMFPRGEPWPGDAWSAKPGGAVVGAATTAQALKDLIAAQDQIESLQRQLENALHTAAQADKGSGEAGAELAQARQEAADAKKAQADAEDVARQVTEERDRAMAEAADLRAKLAKFDRDGDGNPGGAPKPTDDEAAAAKIEAMRGEYEELTGKAADKRWGDERMAEELQSARAKAANTPDAA